MLKTIVHPSVKLVEFIVALKLALYQPQINHLQRVADALIVCDRRKTLTNLYREYVEELDPKTAADFFRESPWQAEDVGQSQRAYMLSEYLRLRQMLGDTGPIVISIDDSLGKKYKDTRHLEAVAYHHDHNASTPYRQVYSNGYLYVESHVQLGLLGFTFDTQLYLREKTVRKLNRQRQPGKRLSFRSKYRIARAMLVEMAALLPKGLPVYVTFDSWYASAKLIKFCRRQGWHVICALKSNRLLNGKSIKKHDQAHKHRRYTQVRVRAADQSYTVRYFTRSLRGRIANIRDEVSRKDTGTVCVIISRRHPGSSYPKYFLSTDLSLSPQEALNIYRRRWPVEVDNIYLKAALGLGDFRLQSFESIQKWFQVVLLALNYLQHQQALDLVKTTKLRPLADFIRIHRQEHAFNLLRSVAERVLACGEIEPVLQCFIQVDQGVT
jgi:hypothetical protein